MPKRSQTLLKVVTAALITLSTTAMPAMAGGKAFDGQWVFTITIPTSSTDNTKRTFTVNLDVSPRGDSLNGRLTATDDQNRVVSGAWRQVGKRISVTYELPCPDDGSSACGSVVLLGKIKGDGALVKKGTVIVMWDTPSDSNPALYDTSNGTFNGTRSN